MNPPITMQYHLLPGGGAAHPAAFQPHPNHRAPAPNNVMQVTFLTITRDFIDMNLTPDDVLFHLFL